MFKKLSAFIVVIISLLSFSLFATHAFADTFAVSNLTFDHTAGTFSFDYSGYTGGDTANESVAIHADDESWGYNAESNHPCTGTTSGHCSGSFTKNSGTFSCSGTIYVQIYGFNAGGYIVSGLTNPDPSCSNPTPTPTPTATPTPTPSTFAVSNLTFDHTAGTFSFDYSGYTGGNTSTESVAIHADDESWGYNAEGNQPCTGSTTGHCSGSFTKNSGTFSCSGTIYVQIYGFNAGGYIVSGLTNPDPSCTNHAPQVGTVTVSPNPVQINTSVTASANFTDADSGDTHTATANWGDNTSATSCTITEPNGATPGSASCPRPSGYPTANVYSVTITVSDGTASGTSPVEYASVYNPTQQGIFTAGHRYSNPATANPSTSGNVTFGLSYKYQGTMPTGVREFSLDFHAASIHFNATTVSSLVVSNGFATLTGTGTGTINGVSATYNFLVTGVDGGGIRIQITDPSNNSNVIYDTQPNAAVTATPTTSVTGNVIVHN